MRRPIRLLLTAALFTTAPAVHADDTAPTQGDTPLEETVTPAPEPVAPPAILTPLTPEPVQPPARLHPIDPEPAPPSHNRFEVAFNSEVLWFGATRMGNLSSTNSTPSLAFRFTWNPTPEVGVYAGWRGFPGFNRTNSTWNTNSSAWGPVVGARYQHHLTGWLRAVAELDLELLNAETDITIGSLRGHDSGLAFGAVPRIGLGAQLPIGTTIAFELRMMVGYALRTSHDLGDVVFDVPNATTVSPLNLGTSNLSGAMFAFTIGLSF